MIEMSCRFGLMATERGPHGEVGRIMLADGGQITSSNHFETATKQTPGSVRPTRTWVSQTLREGADNDPVSGEYYNVHKKQKCTSRNT